MNPTEIRTYWESIRREKTDAIMARWSDANWVACANEATKLAALNHAIQTWLDTFTPQG